MQRFTEQGLADHARNVLTSAERCRSFHEAELAEIGTAHNALIAGLRNRLMQDISPLDVLTVQRQTYNPVTMRVRNKCYLYMKADAKQATSYVTLERWQQAGTMLFRLFIDGMRQDKDHERNIRSVFEATPVTISISQTMLAAETPATDEQLHQVRLRSRVTTFHEIPLEARQPRALIDDYVTGMPLMGQDGTEAYDGVSAVAHHYILQDGQHIKALADASMQLMLTRRIRPTEPPVMTLPDTSRFP